MQLQRRPLALLAVLAAAGEMGVTRDKLVAYFWPESDEERARNVLRQLLHSVRRDLGVPEVIGGTAELRLNAALITSDAVEFERAIDAGDLGAALAMYRGPYLDGFYLSNAAGFEAWKESERARLARRFAEAAERLARSTTASGAHATAVEIWRRLAVTEPLNSRIALELMRAMAAAGDVGGALKQARVHETMLREELGTAPSPTFARVVEELRTASANLTNAPSAGRAATSERISGARSPGHRDLAASSRPGTRSIGPAGPVDATHPLEPRRRHRLRRAAVAAVTLTALLAAATAVSLSAARRNVALDPASFLILPFQSEPPGSGDATSSIGLDQLFHDELSRWRGVRLVDRVRIVDAMARRGDSLSLATAMALARDLGARNLIWGSVWARNDSASVSVALYDGLRRAPIMERTFRFSRAGSPRAAVRAVVGDLLLAPDVGTPALAAGSPGTTVVEAWRAYARAHASLSGWNIDSGMSQFQAAATADPDFASAHLWVARLAQWSGDRSDGDGRRAAARAVALRDRLTPMERRAALALLALAEHRYDEACAAFAEALRADSLDFAAWYGLAECQAYDSVVVVDRRSPSGWSFRSSYHRAAMAYTRALDLVPGLNFAFRGQAFRRLSGMLFTETTRIRLGVGLADNGGRPIPLGAYPSLSGDTLAFVPFAIPDIRSERLAGTGTTRMLAVQRNRLLLRDLMQRWANSYPESPDALEGYALGLEAVGELGGPGSAPGALDVIRRARTRADIDVTRERRLRILVAHVRMLLKLGDARSARILADSALVNSANPSPTEAAQLAGLAALCGRAHVAASLLGRSAASHDVTDAAARPVYAPLPVVRESLRLLAYASFDGFADSIRSVHGEFERQLATFVEPSRRAAVRSALLRRPLRLAYDELAALSGEKVEHGGDPLIEVGIALQRSDTGRARAIRRELAGQRTHLSPSDIAPDQVLQEVLADLASGDSAMARSTLSASLEGLPGASLRILFSVPTSAALVRSMALQAELASRNGDLAGAQRWAARVAALWSDADPSLHAVADRMRRIASQ